MSEDKLQLKAILASAVGHGLMGTMPTKNGGKFYFFKATKVKEKK